MKITATVKQANEVADGVWHVPSVIDQVLHPATTERPELPTILIVGECTFDRDAHTLEFDFAYAELLSLGGQSRGTIILQTQAADVPAVPQAEQRRGDEGFLHVLESMPHHIRQAGTDLLERIRELDPDGHLERHGRRFINRPDNFVALEPQTRIHEIIVHVRGSVVPNLQQVATQRGYSAFKVKSTADLVEAGRALGLATRRF